MARVTEMPRNSTRALERASYETIPITVSDADKRAMFAIERFILTYRGDDLLHDIERTFPNVSFRAVFLAIHRARHPLREVAGSIPAAPTMKAASLLGFFDCA